MQKWRSSSWPQDHYSLVTYILDPKDYGTRVTIKNERVPVSKTNVNHMELMWENIWKDLNGVIGILVMRYYSFLSY